MVRYHQAEQKNQEINFLVMVGWLPKLIYTQTNIAICFFFLWIKQLYDHLAELNVYMQQTLQELWNGCYDILVLHWPLLICIVEVLICWCIIFGIKRNAPVKTIQASSTEKVSILNLGNIFTIMPVLASLMTDKVSLQLVLILFCLLIYEMIAFRSGCSNPTMFILGYNEYKVISSDNMSHRILTKKEIRKGDECHYVIEFNDIYVEV